MASIVHPIVQNADDQHSRIVDFEEDTMTAAGSHLQAEPKVITVREVDCVGAQLLESFL